MAFKDKLIFGGRVQTRLPFINVDLKPNAAILTNLLKCGIIELRYSRNKFKERNDFNGMVFI